VTGVFHAIKPKDISNIVGGVSTHGPWEFVQYLDSLFYDLWMECANINGMGLGYGLILTAAATRLVLTPFILNSQLISHKYKLLAPDMDEITAAMKRY
jgi:membrane protein insertase Oxa1/YidC/SpoIIIJ